MKNVPIEIYNCSFCDKNTDHTSKGVCMECSHIDSVGESIGKTPIKDMRKKGWYCVQCGKFSKKPQMIESTGKIIYIKDKSWTPISVIKERWIVKEHYDGCRGWD